MLLITPETEINRRAKGGTPTIVVRLIRLGYETLSKNRNLPPGSHVLTGLRQLKFIIVRDRGRNLRFLRLLAGRQQYNCPFNLHRTSHSREFRLSSILVSRAK
jgi:hypothetical protein